MIRALPLLVLLLFLAACEKQQETTTPAEPSPAATPPAGGEQTTAPPAGGEQGGAPAAPEGGGQQPAADWQSLPGADQLAYQIDLQEGEKVYGEVCATCHREGIAGAPLLTDREAWQARIAKGLPALVENSIKGFQGNLGVMPPKGGAQSLSDQQVASSVVYMVQQVPR